MTIKETIMEKTIGRVIIIVTLSSLCFYFTYNSDPPLPYSDIRDQVIQTKAENERLRIQVTELQTELKEVNAKLDGFLLFAEKTAEGFNLNTKFVGLFKETTMAQSDFNRDTADLLYTVYQTSNPTVDLTPKFQAYYDKLNYGK